MKKRGRAVGGVPPPSKRDDLLFDANLGAGQRLLGSCIGSEDFLDLV